MNKTTKASGNFLTRLGKIGRSSSNNEKEIPDSENVIKITNMPLVEQTRITRISKDLSNCRNKGEYWMPGLPWRCIDYLNLNCESEGLYRIPGSGPQVKKWQRRFDIELDVDLLDESDLYDPNSISSMLKSWLHDLPTEIMPASLQTSLPAELEKENPDLPNGKSASSYNLLANERAVHSSGSSEPASNYEDAQPVLPKSSVQRRRENEALETCKPVGKYSNGSFSTLQRSPTTAKVRRPATTEARKNSGDTPQRTTPRQYSHTQQERHPDHTSELGVCDAATADPVCRSSTVTWQTIDIFTHAPCSELIHARCTFYQRD
ncbi:hypothetical protein LTR17_015747 [Elasticomyces elasticus]|nr:hypothetical protein LTR17_015747 [Elasticomyces elasticus]